jgi:topoisomerase-4 subunit A
VIQGNAPVNISVHEVLRYNTDKLVRDLERELTIDLDRLNEKLNAHLLEQIFIEERLYKQIEECESYESVITTVEESLLPFKDMLVRAVTRDDIEKLLEIRIKRISRYDLDKKRRDIKEVKNDIKAVKHHLTDMVLYSINYIDGLLTKYGPHYPRRTEIATFTEVEARKVALSNLTMGYDRENGFLGYNVKAEPENSFPCSEYDKLLLINENGMYKAINVPDKIFVGHNLSWVGKVDESVNFNVVYREGAQGLAMIKRFKMPKFILEKEYRLFPENTRSQIMFLSTGAGSHVRIYFAPSKRASHNYGDFAFDDFLIKGASALGKRVSPRLVRRVAAITPKAGSEFPDSPETPDTDEKQPVLFKPQE